MQDDRREGTSLSTYLGLLRRRGWIVVLCAVVAAVVGYYVSSRQTPQYASIAQVFINKQNLASALTGIDTGAFYQDEVRAVDTEASLAAVPAVAASALRKAHVRSRTAAELLGETSVVPFSDTDILDFTVTDPSPQLASRLATAYAKAFTQYRTNLDTSAVARAHNDVSAAILKLDAAGKQGSPLYTSLAEKEQQLQTLQTLQTSRAYVVRDASIGSKVSPHPSKNAALGLILGLVLGLGFAFGVEALDTRVRDLGEVSERLGNIPFLGRIPSPPRRMQLHDDLTSIADPHGPGAEAFRMLRTNLDFVRLTAKEARLILLTSALEEEGKSTTASNLAVAAAVAGRHVALVDLDMRRPYLHRFFRLEGAPGITDVALGSKDLRDALHRIDLTLGTAVAPSDDLNNNGAGALERDGGYLDVLPTGPLPPNAGQFVTSGAVQSILAHLKETYDLVIIDTPPMLHVGDAAALSACVDGLIVVSRAAKLRRPLLREFRRILDAQPAPKLGYVVTGTSGVGGYDSAYGYGERSYGPLRKGRPKRVAAKGLETVGGRDGG